ncbi:MAG: TolC family protein [Candidatus Aminicenantes bacterium]|nr:TolC family protein [Candidatus Aminicenantes bacterium]
MRKTAGTLVLSLILAALGSAVLAAQEPIATVTVTLDEAIAMALLQNPFYLATQEKVAQAKAQVRQAASGFLPTLNAQGTDTLDEKLFVLEFPSFIPGQPPQRFSIDFTRDYQMALSFGLPLFTGGRLTAGYKQANYGLQASREGVRLSEQETIFNVKRAFYTYLLAKEFSMVAAESLALAEGFRNNVKNLYDVGVASKFELLLAEVQVTNLKPPSIRARNGIEVAALNLKTILGVPLDTPLEIKGELVSPPLDPVTEAVVEEAQAQRPELRQLDYQRLMAGEMLKMARGTGLPSLAIGGLYNLWSDRLMFRKVDWQNYYTISLSLNIPLFNGFDTLAKVGQSKAAIREIEWNRKGLAEMISFEVKQAVLNRAQARETLLSQEKNVEQAREAVRIAELNYTEGLATNLDVVTAQVGLRQASTNYSQALYDCVISDAQLEKALGRSRSEAPSK